MTITTLPEAIIQGIPSATLFGRASRVTVGTIEISNIGQTRGLDVWFQVRRALKPSDPNIR